MLLIAVACCIACAQTGCKALFIAGLIPKPPVKAEFEFEDNTVVVIVDDFQEVCFWPEAVQLLNENIIDQLNEHDVAQRVLPAAAVRRLRQSDARFEERACTEIGRMLQADRVLFVQITEFYATEEPVEASAAAKMSAAVKVINALERKNRAKVRLWPRSHDGRRVHVELGAGAVKRARNRAGIARALTEALAKKIARLFYDRPMDDFEKE